MLTMSLSYKRAAGDSHRQEALRADYEQTVGVWKTLVDVRFRLLALVPTLTATGVGLLGQVKDLASLRVALVAVLGGVTVFAIMLYDLRNSFFHDFAVHRAKAIERRLGLTRTIRKIGRDAVRVRHGGLFDERPRGKTRLLGVAVKHDRALSIAYVASVAAWSALALYSLLTRFEVGSDMAADLWITAAATAFLCVVLAVGMWWHEVRVTYYLHVLTAPNPLDPWPPERDEPIGPITRLSDWQVGRWMQNDKQKKLKYPPLS
jgi:hypothetical protein